MAKQLSWQFSEKIIPVQANPNHENFNEYYARNLDFEFRKEKVVEIWERNIVKTTQLFQAQKNSFFILFSPFLLLRAKINCFQVKRKSSIATIPHGNQGSEKSGHISCQNRQNSTQKESLFLTSTRFFLINDLRQNSLLIQLILINRRVKVAEIILDKIESEL